MGRHQTSVDRPGVDSDDIKSVTFIASTLQDNQILMKRNPGYLANLKALPLWKENDYCMETENQTSGSCSLSEPDRKILAETEKIWLLYAEGWDLAATDKDENDEAAFYRWRSHGEKREWKVCHH